MTVDLNKLRETVLSNQRTGSGRPTEKNKQVFVDRDGRIVEGTKTAQADSPLSVVPQETFAARIDSDRSAVNQYLPYNTNEVTTEEGVTGWIYSFDTELGYSFTLFAYFDGAHYQVKLIEPELESYWETPHTGHLFSDGRICFGDSYRAGMPDIRSAYSKSVLWANGISIALQTGKFPFSVNNLND